MSHTKRHDIHTLNRLSFRPMALYVSSSLQFPLSHFQTMTTNKRTKCVCVCMCALLLYAVARGGVGTFYDAWRTVFDGREELICVRHTSRKCRRKTRTQIGYVVCGDVYVTVTSKTMIGRRPPSVHLRGYVSTDNGPACCEVKYTNNKYQFFFLHFIIHFICLQCHCDNECEQCRCNTAITAST